MPKLLIQVDVTLEYFDVVEINTAKGIEFVKRWEVTSINDDLPMLGELIREGDYGWEGV